MFDQINTRVPAEFIGLARAFRNEVRAADVAMDKALDAICKPLHERLKRNPKLRAAMLPEFARRYTELIPVRFRIGEVGGTRHKTEFAVIETRLCVSWMINDRWSDPDAREQGITLCKFTLAVHRGRLARHWAPLVNVSLHALGRRLERGHERSHEALTRDLVVLADAGDDGERVNTSDGFWLGSMVNANNTNTGGVIRIRNVRTWLDADG